MNKPIHNGSLKFCKTLLYASPHYLNRDPSMIWEVLDLALVTLSERELISFTKRYQLLIDSCVFDQFLAGNVPKKYKRLVKGMEVPK